MNQKQLELICDLNKAFIGINAAYADIAKKFNLNYNSFMVVYNMEHMEKCTQKNLRDILLVSKSTMHSILLSLIKKGLVELQSDPDNKKERIIVPTSKGTAFFQEACKSAHEIEEAILQEMDCEQYLERSRQYETILKKHVKESLYTTDR